VTVSNCRGGNIFLDGFSVFYDIFLLSIIYNA
jgi:hypothetical protein